MTTETAKIPWRAHAASDADRAATTSDQIVDALRRATVRSSLEILRRAELFPSVAARRAHVTRRLADSVEKQARFSGLGRVFIPTEVES